MKRYLTVSLLFLFSLLGPTTSFAQKVHEWNVNTSPKTPLKAEKGDIISLIGFSAKKEFSFSKGESKIYEAGDTIVLSGSFIEARKFGLEIKITCKPTKNVLSIQIVAESTPEAASSEVEQNSSIVYDAIALHVQKDMPCKVKAFLTKYKIKDSTELSKNSMLKGINFPKEACVRIGEIQNNFLSISEGSVGGLNTTQLIDSLVTFLINRSKEELAIRYFDNFKRAISSKNNPEFRSLLPATHKGLEMIGDDIFFFHRHIPMLKGQFQSDLNSLPENFKELIIKDNSRLFSDTSHKAAVIFAADIAIGIKNEQHPGEIIQSLTKEYLKPFPKDVAGGLATVRLISESIREPKTELIKKHGYWVQDSITNLVLTNPDIFKIYLGLLIQQAKIDQIQFEDSTSLADKLNLFAENYFELKAPFQEIIFNTRKISALLKKSRESGAKKLPANEISAYIMAANVIFAKANYIVNKLNIQGNEGELASVFGVIDQFTRLLSNVIDKQYPKALFNVSILYQELVLQKAIKKYANGNKEEEKKLERVNRQLKLFKKYSSFIAAILQIQKPEEFNTVLETYALPPGSSMIKRKSFTNVSINAYVGPYAGIEFPINGVANVDSVLGITAPLGISWSFGKISKKHHSLGLFFSLIDLGAITELRLVDNETVLSKIFLREIFSPGVFISWGWANSPISTNLGIQRTAFLKSVGANENILNVTPSLRLSLSLAVDIPLLNIRTKESRKIKD
ncbi:MAG: hypothetical protein R8P61_00635 [Bacteroidia bacterium]|nr:hypothetical protein [Bacteroidia bacterium]